MSDSQLYQALAELTGRIATISKAAGYNTDLGAHVEEPGTWLTEEDAPCVSLYEAAPDREGVMRVDAVEESSCEQKFTVPYVVQAFVSRESGVTLLQTAEQAALDLMRALMGSNRGALATAGNHHLTGHGRGVTVKGGNIAPVLIYGSFTVKEGIFS